MIENITNDVLTKLLNNAPSSVLDGYVGMRAHMLKMEQLLCLDSDDEVRILGIWDPSGIGKSTIARALFGEYSHKFQLSVFIENIRRRYPIPCPDLYSTQLQLQSEMLSRIFNQQAINIRHLDVAKHRLKDKRMLVVLDDVDHVMQLNALAKEAQWFGPGSRIIITTQDKRVLHRHRMINHIHEVCLPSDNKALKIFCMYAFGQKSPYYGFESLARKVTQLAGNLPLGLMVMGSYFRGMSSRHEWEMELPRLWSSLNGEIQSVLKFSYNALCDEDKNLFIYIACFFNDEWIERVEDFLAENFSNVRYGLHVLADKSLISIDRGWIRMHNLLARFGREIVRKQSIHGPGQQRQFLVDGRETCQILSSNSYTPGSINVIGIDCEYSEIEGGLYKNDKAFEKMSNLQFLRVGDTHPRVQLPQSQKYLPGTLRLLDWDGFPMTCFPSNFNPEFLVEIYMPSSNLEKLWEGSQTIKNLKRMYLRDSENLKEVPDLSAATNLWKLDLSGCSSLVELPSSIGNATNLNELFLSRCSSLVELPSSIGNATKLKKLNLSGCSSLVELPSSIGNATDLTELDLCGCTSLVSLPSSIGNLHKLCSFTLKGCAKIKEEALPVNINMKSLRTLDLAGCSLLKTFPEIYVNIQRLSLNGTGIQELPSSITSWSHLYHLAMPYSESLGTHAFGLITELHVACDQRIRELGPWIKEMSRLRRLVISGCTKIVSLPQFPDSLRYIEAENCESLERLDSSFEDVVGANFGNCFKLKQETREMIIRTCRFAVLPAGEQMPVCFLWQARGSSLSTKWNGTDPPPIPSMACVLVVNKVGDMRKEKLLDVYYCIMDGTTTTTSVRHRSGIHSKRFPVLNDHLYTFEIEEKVISCMESSVFEFEVRDKTCEVRECALNLVPPLCLHV
nr:PREDICTED: probable disease resistance protein RPP1 isoform X2 [Raphanus sativus]